MNIVLIFPLDFSKNYFDLFPPPPRLQKFVFIVFFPLGFAAKILYTFIISHVYCMSFPSYLPWFNYPSSVWQRVQIMILILMQFS
jgi:hypothetical protein